MSRPAHTMLGSAGSGMRKLRPRIVALGALIVASVLLCVFRPPWVIESKGARSTGSAAAGSANLNPDKYVASIWSSKILPAVEKDAIDLPTLLTDLKRDPASAAKRYGHYAIAGGPPSFLVKGSGHVVSVDTLSLVSTAGIAFGSQKKPSVLVQIGPVLSGTDIRDALPFINFNQFVNQVQYGEVAISINARVTNTVLTNLDVAKLKGKHVVFSGAYTTPDPNAPSAPTLPTITPVTLEVGK